MLEELEMWQDANESFTRMCENGKMENGLWGEMMQLNSPKLQKGLKEIRYGNSKAALHEIAKKDGSMGTFVRAVFSFGRTPLD